MKNNYKIIRDPVVGFIRLNEAEERIINTKPFQRLRYIKQLGLSSMVYPGADHTRFAHSLGVMELATKVYDVLIAKHENNLLSDWKKDNLIKKYRQQLRLAALLHDIGHAPFSHASDKLIVPGWDHEKYGEEIIKCTELKDLIDSYFKDLGIKSDDIVNLLSRAPLGTNPFLQTIIKGDLDVDRMDYLLRDSLFTGVICGTFDYNRLIHTLTLRKDKDSGQPILSLERGGLHSAENMILARYFMFTQVYFHKIRRSFDILLLKFIENILSETGNKYPTNINEYLDWDDVKVLYKMKEESATGNKEASRILNRECYECIFETAEHPSPEEIDLFRDLLSKIKEKYSDIVFYDDTADNVPHHFKILKLYIEKEGYGQEEYGLIEDESAIIKNLPEKIYQKRLYYDGHRKKEVEAYRDEIVRKE